MIKNKYFSCVIFTIATFILYNTAFNYDFVNLDDSGIYDNILLQDFSFEGIKNIFLSFDAEMYQPLTSTFLAVVITLFGVKSATAFHVFNILIHLFNVLLVYFITDKIQQNKTKGFLIAFIFAIHPLAVESVVWVSAISTLLFTFFFLIGLSFYINFIESDTKHFYYKSLLFFILGCLCKVQIIPFVGILFLTDYLYNKPIFSKKRLVQKIPFILIACVFIFIAIRIRDTNERYTLITNSFSDFYFASVQIAWYIKKSLVPFPLVFIYNWPIKLTFLHHLSVVFLLMIFYSVYHFRRKKVYVFGALFFILNIILQTSLVSEFLVPYSDRYAYLSSLGVWIALFAFFNKEQLKYSTPILLLLFFMLSKRQIKTWKNSETLWTHSLKYEPNAFSYNNLGSLYMGSDKEKAKAYFLKAVELPKYTSAYFNLGVLFFNTNRTKAEYYFNKSIELDPKKEKLFYNYHLLHLKYFGFHSHQHFLFFYLVLEMNHF